MDNERICCDKEILVPNSNKKLVMYSMEATAVVKGTHHSCSPNLVRAISIDLNNANDDIGTRKCEHFSIRYMVL
ncbi:hypothetical protein V6N11_056528 [Hibiscus sabdariffa]|uniref:Uncharacterized protein n=1 Tax=Hibiscus sabdariffa TaxID=183260 RepID=A0ABR2T4K3_9ROSI